MTFSHMKPPQIPQTQEEAWEWLTEWSERVNADIMRRRTALAERLGGYDALCTECSGDGIRQYEDMYDTCIKCNGSGAKVWTVNEDGQAVPIA